MIAPRKLRCGLIGLGHQAISDHIPGISKSKFASLAAICDISKELVDEWSGKLQVPGYTDYERMMDAEHLDFVLVVSPHHTHSDIVRAAATRRIHVLKEKPLARSLREGEYIKLLCEEHQVHLMVTLQRRFNPIYASFFQLIDYIGKPFFIEAKYTIYTDSPHTGWRGSRVLSGGGCIIDMGYHMIDMLIWFFGLPDIVSADFSANARPEFTYDAEDSASIQFRYLDRQLHGHLLISRSMPPKTEILKVYGTDGIIELTRGNIRRLTPGGEVIESLSRENSWDVAATNQIDYFCRVIEGERANLGSPDYHLQHLRFIEACYSNAQDIKMNGGVEIAVKDAAYPQ